MEPVIIASTKEGTTATTAANDEVDVSYHVVPFPAGVGYAAVSCSATRGVIRLTRTSAGEQVTSVFQPDSPIYHIQNDSCAGNVLLPLVSNNNAPLVVLATFDNNSKEPAVITVVVALSFPPHEKQHRLLVKRKLSARQSTTVHVVFPEA